MRAAELRRAARDVVRGTGALLSGRDVSAAAATMTYFAGIAVVPWLLYAVWSTTWTAPVTGAERRLLRLEPLVPAGMGARPSFEQLIHAGTHLSPLSAVVLLFPASFYGEGVRRACLLVHPGRDRFTGWHARLAVLPLVVVVAPLAGVLFVLARPLAEMVGAGSFWITVLRVVIGFTGLWLALSVVMTWVYRMVAPGDAGWLVCAVGGLVTGSFLAGFLHGFQLFLSFPIDVGVPFGGLGVVGGVVAAGLWLFVLHTVVVVGWAFTAALGDRVAGAPGAVGQGLPGQGPPREGRDVRAAT